MESWELTGATSNARANDDDSVFNLVVTLIDYSTATNYHPKFTETLNGIDFGKSFNQNALDAANLVNQTTLDAANITFSPKATIIDNIYDASTITTNANYTFKNVPTSATYALTVPSGQSFDPQGNADFTVNVNATFSLGQATRNIPIAVSFTKLDKQAKVTALESLMSTLSLTGYNHESMQLVSSDSDFDTKASDKSLAKFQYTYDDGTT